MTEEVIAQSEPTPEDTSPVIVEEAPDEEAPKLRVRSRKVADDVILADVPADVPDSSARSDGETRTTTDQGPVQLVNLRSEPREVDVIDLPSGLSITRERY